MKHKEIFTNLTTKPHRLHALFSQAGLITTEPEAYVSQLYSPIALWCSNLNSIGEAMVFLKENQKDFPPQTNGNILHQNSSSAFNPPSFSTVRSRGLVLKTTFDPALFKISNLLKILVTSDNKATPCCLDKGYNLLAFNHQQAFISSLHSLVDNWAQDTPPLYESYPHTSALGGNKIEYLNNLYDELHPGGMLYVVHTRTSYMLYLDSQNQPRGWEVVVSNHKLPRYGHPNNHYFLDENQELKAYDTPPLTGLQSQLAASMLSVGALNL